MVDLSGNSPYQHGFPNVVFILPAIVVIGLASKYLELVKIFEISGRVKVFRAIRKIASERKF